MLTLKTLTPEQIDAMPAGREMDALVSEQLMGIKVGWAKEVGSVLILFEPHPFVVGTGTEIPDYSTDIAAAWKVIENMEARDDDRMYNELAQVTPLWALDSSQSALTICRAALKAVIR